MECAAHRHTPVGMAVSPMECGLFATPTSCGFSTFGYHDVEVIDNNVGERERL
jgi:hypothetical protein